MASEECNITIPPEIITDILYRLPSKSIGRFRCVSKGWLSLLTQPHFIKTHQNILNQHHIILFSDDKSFYTLPFHHQEVVLSKTKVLIELPDFNIIKCYDACEGLVLMSAYDFGGLHKLLVLNPTTKKFLELPESGYAKVDHMLGIHIMYVFCYDSVTDDYKVVTISYFHYNYLIPPDTMSLHVYSLRTNTWKWLIDYPFNLYAWMELSNAFVNGCLHWLAKKGYYDALPVIVAFSLADEKFTEVSIPYMGNNVDIMSNKNSCQLLVLDGKLATFYKDEIWLMYEYGVKESWTKIVLHGLGEIPMAEPMLVDHNCKLLLASSDRMLIHNLDEHTSSKTVCIWSHKDLKVKGTYVESLVSPKFS